MYKYILTIFITLISHSAFALQMENVVDDETVSAKISSIDVTRIVVQGDRIKSLRGIKGAYTHENDEKNGEVFIQPTAAFQGRAFTVLLETEQGRHFNVLLNPLAIPSETLMLVPKSANHIASERFEKASPYELTLKHLVQNMKSGEVPDGYVVSHIDDKKTYHLGNIADVHLKTIYQGVNLKGEIFEVRNKRSTAITIDEREFYKEGTRAISLDAIEIAPYSSIYLYRVVNNA